jgi:hypothetical protein
LNALVLNIVHSLDSQNAVLNMVTGLSQPWYYILLTGSCLLNAAIYALFEGAILKKNLKIQSLKSLKALLSSYNEQADLAKEMHCNLSNVLLMKKMKLTVYEKLIQVDKRFNKDIRDLRKKFPTDYDEDPFVKRLRNGLSFFGAFMAGCGAFFVLKAAIKTFAAVLLGAPVAYWLVVGLLVVGAVSVYLGLKPKKLFTTLNPAASDYNPLREKLLGKTFDVDESCELLLREKRVEQKKPVMKKRLQRRIKTLEKENRDLRRRDKGLEPGTKNRLSNWSPRLLSRPSAAPVPPMTGWALARVTRYRFKST